MDPHAQGLLYLARQLGYLTAGECDELAAGGIAVEPFLQQKLAARQLLYLRVVFVASCLTKVARETGYLTGPQCDNLLKMQMTGLKKAQAENRQPGLIFVENGSVPVRAVRQWGEQLQNAGIFTAQDWQLLTGMLAQAAPTQDVHPDVPTDEQRQIAALASEPTMHLSPEAANASVSALPANAPHPTPMADKIQRPAATPPVTDNSKPGRVSHQAKAVPSTPPKGLPAVAGGLQKDFLGPYKLLKEIGSGGMGKVYKAYHTQLERVVAIKVMLTGSNISEKDRSRFLEEAKLTAKLHHPNIVAVHDVSNTGGQDYIVMDFIDGSSLGYLLKTSKITQRKALEIMREVALAIDYAHQNGVVHRDLKPENIMVEKATGRAVVMDFGLAKNIKFGKELTRSGEVLGTPRYMAPEQAIGNMRAISPATDVYALGAILYEMLAGVPAVDGATPYHIIANILNKEVISLRKRNPRLAVDLETICQKAMDKEIPHRYPGAKAFSDDIGRFLEGEMVLARPRSLLVKLWKKLSRHKLVAGMATACLVILAIGALWGWQTIVEQAAISAWNPWWENFYALIHSDHQLLTNSDALLAQGEKIIQQQRQFTGLLHQKKKTNLWDDPDFQAWAKHDNALFTKWREFERLLGTFPNILGRYNALQLQYRQLQESHGAVSGSDKNHKNRLAGIDKNIRGYFHLADTQPTNPAQMAISFLQNKIKELRSQATAACKAYKLAIKKSDPDQYQPELIELARWHLEYALALEREERERKKLQETKIREIDDMLQAEYSFVLAQYNQSLAAMNRPGVAQELLAECLRRLQRLTWLSCVYAPAYFQMGRIYHLQSETTRGVDKRNLARIYYEKGTVRDRQLNFFSTYYLLEIYYYLWREEPNLKEKKKWLEKFWEFYKKIEQLQTGEDMSIYRQMASFFKVVVEGETVYQLTPEYEVVNASYLNFSLCPPLSSHAMSANDPKYQEGIARYRQLLGILQKTQTGPLGSQLRYLEGQLYADLGLLEEIAGDEQSYLEKALVCFHEAVQREPWQAQLWWKLAQLHAIIGDFPAAEGFYQKSFAAFATSEEIWYRKAHWPYIVCLVAQNTKEKKQTATQEIEKYLHYIQSLSPEQLATSDATYLPIRQAKLSLLMLLYLEEGKLAQSQAILPLLQLETNPTKKFSGLPELAYAFTKIKAGDKEAARAVLLKVWNALLSFSPQQKKEDLYRQLALFSKTGLSKFMAHYDDLFQAPPNARVIPPGLAAYLHNLLQSSGVRNQLSNKIVTHDAAGVKQLISLIEADKQLQATLHLLMQQEAGSALPLEIFFHFTIKAGIDTMEKTLLSMQRLPSADLYYRRAIAFYRQAMEDKTKLTAMCLKALQDIQTALAQKPGDRQYHYAAALLYSHLSQGEADSKELAYLHLELAMLLGWNHLGYTAKDSALEPLRADKRWQRLTTSAAPKLLYQYSWDEAMARVTALLAAGKRDAAALWLATYKAAVQANLGQSDIHILETKLQEKK